MALKFEQIRKVKNFLVHTECCRAPKNGYRSRPTPGSTTGALPCQILSYFAYVVKNFSQKSKQHSTFNQKQHYIPAYCCRTGALPCQILPDFAYVVKNLNKKSKQHSIFNQKQHYILAYCCRSERRRRT